MSILDELYTSCVWHTPHTSSLAYHLCDVSVMYAHEHEYLPTYVTMYYVYMPSIADLHVLMVSRLHLALYACISHKSIRPSTYVRPAYGWLVSIHQATYKMYLQIDGHP